jgi:CDP-glycerol glycerophosphotransferase (TagB/SpsB family)
LNDGEYDDLFNQSDAIIHDCSSFIAEYAVTRKPALYLLSKSSQSLEFLNEFGECALQSYEKATSTKQIQEFILRVLGDANPRRREVASCFDEYLSELYGSELPSEKILKDIKVALGAPRLSSENLG